MRFGQYQIDWLRLPPSQWRYFYQPAAGLAANFRYWTLNCGPISLQKRLK